MLFRSVNDKLFCALYFGIVASVLIIPLLTFNISRSLGIEAYSIFILSIEYIASSILLGFIPLALAAFFGSLFGTEICSKRAALSRKQAFLIGIKTLTSTVIYWWLFNFLCTVAFACFFNVDTVFALGLTTLIAMFWFPVFAILGGLGGIGLRILAIKRG